MPLTICGRWVSRLCVDDPGPCGERPCCLVRPRAVRLDGTAPYSGSSASSIIQWPAHRTAPLAKSARWLRQAQMVTTFMTYMQAFSASTVPYTCNDLFLVFKFKNFSLKWCMPVVLQKPAVNEPRWVGQKGQTVYMRNQMLQERTGIVGFLRYPSRPSSLTIQTRFKKETIQENQ